MLVLESVPRRLPGPGVAWALVVLALALFGVHEWMVPVEAQATTLCVFRHVTGVPCPTCGTTRSVTALARGDVTGAFGFNPLMAAVMVAVVLVVSMRVVIGKQPMIRLERQPRRVVWSLVTLLFVANWVYVIVRDGVLPPE